MSPGNLRLVQEAERPPLALLVRDGDPAPAIVAVVATDLPSAPTVALSAILDARLRAAGLAVDTRADRSSFRVRLLGPPSAPATSSAGAGQGGADLASTFLAALLHAFQTPIAAGTPEIAAAADRIAALRRHPLPAPEAAPAAECTGRLGLAPGEPALDPLTPRGLTELEAARARVLTARRTAIGAAGPAAFCHAAERALSAAAPWPDGPPPEDVWPAADTAGTHPANDVAPRRARVTVALRLAEPAAAVAAAGRLAEPDGPLRARLAALPAPFHLTEVLGVARPRGGCISLTAETDADVPGGRDALAGASALVAAIARKEVTIEARAPAAPDTAARAVQAAADPRDAAARAAWWALAAPARNRPDVWSTVLALAPDERADLSAAARRFEAGLATATIASSAPVVERRSVIERGQGVVWILLASTCGAADEGPLDAGASSLAALAATSEVRHAAGVPLDPWVTAEGAGVLVHGPAAVDEDPLAHARRLAGAAARAFAGGVPGRDAVAAARAAVLAQIERAAGPHGAAMDALLGTLTPEHPSQLFALGPFARVAALATPNVAGRWQSLANGPLRMAVLANGDAPQVSAAFAEADRWLAPRPSPRACTQVSDAALQPGRYEAQLPQGAELSHALIAVNVAARGQPGHALAELAAHLLGGERGLVQAALDRSPVPASASVRLLGGARSAAVVIDLRAPRTALDDAVAEVKALLARLGQEGPPEAALEAALAKKRQGEQEAAFDPRSRLVRLWMGLPAAAEPLPTRAALQSFFGTSFRESALAVVEAK